MLFDDFFGSFDCIGQSFGADFIGFGQDNLLSDGRFVEQFHRFFVDLFYAVPRIDEPEKPV